MPVVKKLRRICKVCGKLYIPSGRNQKLCNSCQYKAMEMQRKRWKKK